MKNVTLSQFQQLEPKTQNISEKECNRIINSYRVDGKSLYGSRLGGKDWNVLISEN